MKNFVSLVFFIYLSSQDMLAAEWLTSGVSIPLSPNRMIGLNDGISDSFSENILVYTKSTYSQAKGQCLITAIDNHGRFIFNFISPFNGCEKNSAPPRELIPISGKEFLYVEQTYYYEGKGTNESNLYLYPSSIGLASYAKNTSTGWERNNSFGNFGLFELNHEKYGIQVGAVFFDRKNLNIYMTGSFWDREAKQNKESFIVKINHAGKIDQDFGVNGYLMMSEELSGKGFGFSPVQFYFEKDNKILLVGIGWDGVKQFFTQIRINNQGYLDTTFGDQGILRHELDIVGFDVKTGVYEWADMYYKNPLDASFLLRTIKGFTDENQCSLKDVRLQKLTSDGTLDVKFGQNGKLKLKEEPDHHFISKYGMFLVKGRYIYILDSFIPTKAMDTFCMWDAEKSYFKLERFDKETGAKDLEYDPEPIFNQAIHQIQAYILTNEDKIFIKGETLNKENSAAFNSIIKLNLLDGKLDQSFGVNGVLTY